MKKPGLLRAAITALLPEFGRDPDNLAMWVERGRCRSNMTRQRGFAWEYDLTVVAQNYCHPPELLFFLVVNWLRDMQPDLLATGGEGFAFEVDVIDDKTFDVKITLPLREIVSASAAGGGGWNLEVVPEQVPLFPDEQPLRTGEGPITSIWLHSTGAAYQIAPDPAP